MSLQKAAIVASIFFLCSFWSLEAQYYYSNLDLTPYNHQLVGIYEFDGDKHGDFVGDTVAVLDDVSFWKIHPKHTEIFEKWHSGETIHVTLRTSWYFFKREHKFALYNDNRKEEVYAMLVQSPFLIYHAESPQVTKTYNGQPSGFSVNITLNDGSRWEVTPDNNDIVNHMDRYFNMGTPAYIGYNVEEGKVFFFMINEIEREAKWRWARIGHFDYYDN